MRNFLAINENLVFNKNDLEINLHKFESGESNVLLVTGFSGSGKSTLAKDLASKYGCTVFELDCLYFYCSGLITKEELFEEEPGLTAFINNTNLEPNADLNNKEISDLYRSYIKFLIDWCRTQKDKKFIIEGLQIYDTYREGDRYITSCPMIIKGTSGLVSAIRAAKRNEGNFIKNFKPLIQWLIKDNKVLDKLKKDMVKNQHTLAEEFKLYENLWN